MKKILTLLTILGLSFPLFPQTRTILPETGMEETVKIDAARYAASYADIPDTEADWGEWYVEAEGAVEDPQESVFSVMAIKNGAKATVMKRDDANDPDHSQLKLIGAFENLDFIMDLENSTGTLSWPAQDLGVDLPDYYVERGMAEFALCIAANSDDIPRQYRHYEAGKRIDLQGLCLIYAPFTGTLIPLIFNAADIVEAREAICFSAWRLYEGNSVEIEVKSGAPIEKISFMKAMEWGGSRPFLLDNGESAEYNDILLRMNDPEPQDTEVLRPGESGTLTFNREGCYNIFVRIDYKNGLSDIRSTSICVLNPTPEKWRPLGKGIYTDTDAAKIWYLCPVPDIEAESREVEVEYNTENPALFRIRNPFRLREILPDGFTMEDEATLYGTVSAQFDRDHDYYLLFDASSPLQTYCPLMPLPWRVILGGKVVREVGTSILYDHLPSDDGIVYERENAKMIFHDSAIFSNAYNCVTPHLQLPSNELFTLEKDEEQQYTIHFGENAGAVYYAVSHTVSGLEGALKAARDAALAGAPDGRIDGYLVARATDGARLDISHLNPVYSRHYYVAVYASGNGGGAAPRCDFADVRESRSNPVYYSTATYHDEMMVHYRKDLGSQSFAVDVYMDPDIPNVFFLERPYGTNSYVLRQGDVKSRTDFDRFMVVNCLIPDRVFVEGPYNPGIRLGKGPVYIHSKNQEDGEYRYAYDDYQLKTGRFGTCRLTADGYRIKYPVDLLELSDDTGKYSFDPYYSGTITIDIPFAEESGVEDVAADPADGPVRYYNLQGIEVRDPAGGVFIRRCGNKTEKVCL